MISKVTITYLVLVIFLIDFAQTKFTDVPPPPPRPEHFHSKDELKQYLQKVREYYLIIGRWRLRRSAGTHLISSTPEDDLFRFFDTNNDHYISAHEFAQRLKFEKAN